MIITIFQPIFIISFAFRSRRCPSEPSKQLQAKLITQATCVKRVEQQVCYYSGDDEKNVIIFMLLLNFPAKEDYFYYHPLINWAITELLRQPKQSTRGTPVVRSENQCAIRYIPRRKLLKSRWVLHTGAQIYSSSISYLSSPSMSFPSLKLFIDSLTHPQAWVHLGKPSTPKADFLIKTESLPPPKWKRYFTVQNSHLMLKWIYAD